MVTDPAGLIVGREGSGLTVTTTVGEGTLWQPEAFVTCTERLLEAVTIRVRVVAPLDHR